MADVAKEIYAHGSLVQATWPHFSPIYIWISDTFYDSLDDLVKGMGISRRNVGKNYMGQKQIFSLQSLIVRQFRFHKFTARQVSQEGIRRKKSRANSCFGSLYICINREETISLIT